MQKTQAFVFPQSIFFWVSLPSSPLPRTSIVTRSLPGNDEEDEWEGIEAEQAALDDDEDSSSSNNSSDESSDDGEIKLHGSIESISDEYTFEFNDMRDDFAEGVCTLLRSIVANPTEAYELACAIVAQSKDNNYIPFNINTQFHIYTIKIKLKNNIQH